MHAALALTSDGEGELRVLGGDDRASARPLSQPADPAQVAALERSASPRWVFADVAATYPALLRSGLRLSRCHDLASTEALLLAAEGDAAGAAAVTAARAGAATSAAEPAPQPSLFDDDHAVPSPAVPDAAAVGEAYVGQLARLDRIPRACPASACSWRPSRRPVWPPPR